MAAFYLRQPDDSPVKETNFINLALIKDQATWRNTIQRSADDIVCDKEHTSYGNLFDDIGILDKKFILLVGRPGSGKTVLMNNISRDWANNKILKSSLVIYVPLRKLTTEHDSQLATILKVACPALKLEERKQLVSHIEQNKGEKVVFAFDGFDEYKPKKKASPKKKKVEVEDIFDILYGRSFPKALVILTSRPAACIDFRRYAGKQVEVLGFLKEQVINYMNYYFKSDRKKAEKLVDHLKVYPNLMNMCYLPLHSSMLATIADKDIDLPKTETEFYERFTLSAVIRSIMRRSDTKQKVDQIVKLKAFHELPRDDRKLFNEVCKLAFNATLESKLVFTSSVAKHIAKTDSLGLIVKDVTTYMYEVDETYTFLHLTLQEYLAALHITGLSESKQKDFIKAHGKKQSLHVVKRFFCGMLNFSGSSLSSMGKFKTLVEVTSDILFQFHYAYEAKDPQPCHYVVSSLLYHIELRNKILNLSDCRTIGAVINKSRAHVDNGNVIELELESCTISIDGIVIFLQEVGDCPFSLELRYCYFTVKL